MDYYSPEDQVKQKPLIPVWVVNAGYILLAVLLGILIPVALLAHKNSRSLLQEVLYLTGSFINSPASTPEDLPKDDDLSTNNVSQAGECQRTEPYSMRPEFERALSLIDQRFLEHDPSNPIMQVYRSNNLKNCLAISYAEPGDPIKEAEGYFYSLYPNSVEQLVITVSTEYYERDDLLTAILLTHELTHAVTFSAHLQNDVQHLKNANDCYNDETAAFTNELFFLGTLNSSEAESLSARAKLNNPSKGVVALKALATQVDSSPGSNVFEKVGYMVRHNRFYIEQCNKFSP